MAEDEDGAFDADITDDCVNWCPTCGHPSNPVHVAEIVRLRAVLAAARQDAERLRICAAALTPMSENEKRGMERALAILDRKIAEGGGCTGSDANAVERHNAHFRARWSAFSECASMLRAALQCATGDCAGKEG